MVSLSQLEHLYQTYNKACYIDPDPLVFLHRYSRVEDREIVGLIASGLAFGRVAHICASLEKVLEKMGPSPRTFLEKNTDKSLFMAFTGFRHRYVGDRELAGLLIGIRRNLTRYGSLNRCFLEGFDPANKTVIPALTRFVETLDCPGNYLLPSPEKGSACKRLHLYLRWMIRSDEVDPGGWTGIPASRLVIPVDTHMARISKTMGFTRRRSPDSAMALDITRWFRRRIPHDPVKFDFALTRFGIRSELRHAPLPR